ncbi:MAG: transketolase, partial [Myxococcales bacterium]|nr:transketolase [Myxococcales bacterium]
FVVPDDVRGSWRRTADRGRATHAAWRTRLEASAQRADFEQASRGDLLDAAHEALAEVRAAFIEGEVELASRQASQKVLERLVPAQPGLVGGSADLTGSNGTRTSTQRAVEAGDFGGDYVNYGIREHAMGAVMNGLALHRGLIPYGGTFLVFSDYARPSIRLSALMGQRVVYVLT